MRIALLVTCLVDTVVPGVGKATTEILERLGHDVVFPAEQTCCGQIHVNAGFAEHAIPLARRTTRIFSDPGFDAVVSPSASCVVTLRDQYPRLAARAGGRAFAEEAAVLASRVFELSQFLVEVLGVEDVGARFPHRVAYHPTCHGLRHLGLGEAPLRLLRNVRGIELVDLPAAETCCGFGGTFAVKNADTSAAMLGDKVRSVGESGAEFCVAGDSSCLLQIGGGLSRERASAGTIHLAEILASRT